MLNEAQTFMGTSPYLAIFPGCAIALAVLGFNLLGDGLRDMLDPKLSRIQFGVNVVRSNNEIDYKSPNS